jgi:hypothetical protein
MHWLIFEENGVEQNLQGNIRNEINFLIVIIRCVHLVFEIYVDVTTQQAVLGM